MSQALRPARSNLARRVLLPLALALLAVHAAQDEDGGARLIQTNEPEPRLLAEEPGQLTACPNDCSFYGVCIQETCHCDVGYSGDDCSYPVMAFVNFGVRSIDPPTGLALGGTRVFLTGFNLVESLVCRFEPIANVASNQSFVASPRLVAATYHNSTTVSCVAPPSAFVLSSVEEVATMALASAPPSKRKKDSVPPPSAPAPPSYIVSELAHAALHTPDAEYLLELALTPPHFTNNGMRFVQWDSALFSATPLGGPVRTPPPSPPSIPSPPSPPSAPSSPSPPRRIARPPPPPSRRAQVEGNTSVLTLTLTLTLTQAEGNTSVLTLALTLALALALTLTLTLTQVEGNTSVLVRGRGFRSVSQLQPQCKFGRTRVLATILGSGMLRCYSPATLGRAAGPTGLSVSLDSSTEVGRDWTQVHIICVYMCV